MTHYAMTLIVEQWVKPYFDTTEWEYFDLSCKARDESDDLLLEEAVKAGKRAAAIVKEPTINPSILQVERMGFSKAFGSPNGAMRKGWNGMTINRDTIHVDGIESGYKNRVLFERHAVGGEYSAGWIKAYERKMIRLGRSILHMAVILVIKQMTHSFSSTEYFLLIENRIPLFLKSNICSNLHILKVSQKA